MLEEKERGLVLGRYHDQAVFCTCKCGTRLTVRVTDVNRGRVRLRFVAPRDEVTVTREEIARPETGAIETIWGDI